MTHSGNLVIARVYGVLDGVSVDIVLHKDANLDELRSRIRDVIGDDSTPLKLLFPPENINGPDTVISNYISNKNIYPFYFETDKSFKKLKDTTKFNLPPKVISQTTMKRFSLNSKSGPFFGEVASANGEILPEKEPNASGDELKNELDENEGKIVESLMFDGPPVVHVIIQNDKIIEVGQYSSPREAQDAKFNLAFNTAPSPEDEDEDDYLTRRNKEIMFNLSHLKKNLPMTKTTQICQTPKPFLVFNQGLALFRGLINISQSQQMAQDPEHLVVSSSDRKKALDDLLNERQLQIEEFHQMEERQTQRESQKNKPATSQQPRKKVTLRRSTRPTLRSSRPQRPLQQQQQQEPQLSNLPHHHHPPTAYPYQPPTQQQQPQTSRYYQPTSRSRPSTFNRQSDANRSSAYNKYGILAALQKFHAIKEVQRERDRKLSTAETVRFFGINRPIGFYHS